MPERTLLLRLALEPDNKVAGSVRTEGDRRELAFSGWIGLIEVLETLCQGHDAPARTEEGER